MRILAGCFALSAGVLSLMGIQTLDTGKPPPEAVPYVICALLAAAGIAHAFAD
ncbi:hypothetical protein BONGO_55 [Mycobacterium phage Bongo]|uniref:Membrane protein n=4 Tax=Bongovirus bongo TaxID=1983750 RepID=A0A514DJ51_9CAUD|nr:hypothetical protein FDH95_gp055 [Mycobacterium phage Bongo]AER26098.1 hypothetical protein BONGO_55 [Mycobacterium phage Bongo]AXQ52696.1 hypothetical protein SEA_IPHANE7_55 [Mycobacterium phage IPhane7]QDH93628.1 membrane protein [Mycobacterium phage LilhomieP]QGJ93202.1 hypothetical protein SEA_TYDAWG_55 [Mycobacterium phage TyDawg]